MNTIVKKTSVLLWSLILFSGTLHAGWIIKEQTRYSDRKGKEERMVYVQGDRIKLVEATLTTIMDVARNRIIFYNPKAKIYWEGSIDDYDREVIEGMRQQFMGTIHEYGDSAKKTAIESFERMAGQLLSDTVREAEALNVQVSQTQTGDKYLGYPTRIYMVWVNKVATEEVWIAPDVHIFREPDVRKYWEMFNRITRFYEKGFHYQASPQYVYLMTRGYPVKVKEIGFRYDVYTEVTRIKQKNLPDALFRIPSGASKVPLSDLGL
jgi:hypothetical protein